MVENYYDLKSVLWRYLHEYELLSKRSIALKNTKNMLNW